MTLATASFFLSAQRGQRRARFSLLAWLLHRSAMRRDRASLHALSDHTLRDMGLTRDQVDDAVAGRLTRSFH